MLRCQPSTSLRNHQVQQEGLSISVRTVQPAKVHSFHSTKRLALSTGLFMLGMMSNGQNSYFTSNFLFKGAFTLDFYGGRNKHLHFKVLQGKYMKNKPSLWVWRICWKTGQGPKEAFYGLWKCASLREGPDTCYRPEPWGSLSSQTAHRAEDTQRKSQFSLSLSLTIVVWFDSF